MSVRSWKIGDLVRLRDSGESALIIKVANAATLGCKMIKVHTGEYFAPWKLELINESR
jgi:hypothetical protein